MRRKKSDMATKLVGFLAFCATVAVIAAFAWHSLNKQAEQAKSKLVFDIQGMKLGDALPADRLLEIPTDYDPIKVRLTSHQGRLAYVRVECPAMESTRLIESYKQKFGKDADSKRSSKDSDGHFETTMIWKTKDGDFVVTSSRKGLDAWIGSESYFEYLSKDELEKQRQLKSKL